MQNIDYFYSTKKHYSEINLIPKELILNPNFVFNSDISLYLIDYLEDIVSFINHSDDILNSTACFNSVEISKKLSNCKKESRKELKKQWLFFNHNKNFEDWITNIYQYLYLKKHEKYIERVNTKIRKSIIKKLSINFGRLL